jgi:protein-disulfide isomerase
VRAIFLALGITGIMFSHAILADTPSANVTNAVNQATTKDAANSPTNQIESTVHQYLLKKPEVVVEALQVYQQKQMESMQQLFKETQKVAPQYADVLFHQASDPVMGQADGKIAIVEFSDYQCSHCIEMAPVMEEILKANSNVKLIVKEFPIRGGMSETAARAGLAANKQGKYAQFRAALFKASGSMPALNEDKIYEVAKSVDLNVEQLKKDMNEKSIKDAVAADQKLAKDLKLVGTPAFFIGKSDVKPGAVAGTITYVPGMLSQQQFQVMIDQKK